SAHAVNDLVHRGACRLGVAHVEGDERRRAPRVRTRRAVSSAAATLLRKLMTTAAPSAPSRTAIARPIPREAPVTRATCPAREVLTRAAPGHGRCPRGRPPGRPSRWARCAGG